MADKKKLSYHERRNIEREEYLQSGIDPVQSKIAKAYLQAQNYLDAEVNKLFKRARLKTDMTEEELKKALNVCASPNEILEYQRLAKRIETPEIAEQAKNQLNALAYKHRITRLEDLRAKTHLVVKQIADVEYQQQTDFYIDSIHDSYREAVAEDIIRKLEARGVEVETWNKLRIKVPIEVWNESTKHEFKELSIQATKNILESHWKGSNYSKRIWKDTDKLAQRLEEIFTVESMTGMGDQEMARAIAEEFQTSIGVANRLIRTEANYMANQGRLKGWIDRGVEKYMLVAVLDFRTSRKCKGWDKKVYSVADAVVGENFPPGHPWCRTIAIAYHGERSIKGYRTARDPISGEMFKLLRSADYNDWMNKLKERYSDDEIVLQKKKIRNIQKDNADYRLLKSTISKENSPKSLDEYQNIKYNDSRDWKLTKLDYQRRKKLIDNPELKLPNAEIATIDDRKFNAYLFGGSNEQGLIKGRLITKKLGYSIDNYVEFKREILKRSLLYPVTLKRSDLHGGRYEQKMIMYDVQNKPVNIVAGWNVKDGKTHMSTILIKEVK